MLLLDLTKKAIILLIIGLLVIIGATALFIEIADDILEEEKFQVDHYFQQLLWVNQENSLHHLMSMVTEAGSVLFLTVASIIMVTYMFLTRKNKWMILFFVMNMIGISIMTSVLKQFFSRERPHILEQYDGTGFSFPSGHSTGAIAFYGFIIYMLWKSNVRNWIKWLLIILSGVLAILIPFSRVVLGVHYFTDIVAGIALACSWLVLCIIGSEYVMSRKNNKHKRGKP